MNYDKAHDLAHAMRESEEYKITEGMKVLDHGEKQQPQH